MIWYEGYVLSLTSLIDIDECKNQEMPVCDQLCLNEQGSYRCACQEGYQLSADGRSCKVTGSKLL